jgi:hypothetical protein
VLGEPDPVEAGRLSEAGLGDLRVDGVGILVGRRSPSVSQPKRIPTGLRRASW